jgi:8-oxo-dGTP pyrophosphatase MutT (NUDIX family)
MHDTPAQRGLLRHIRACNNADLPGARVPLFLHDEPAGFADPLAAAALGGGPGPLRLDDPAALQAAARRLANEGRFRWRYEAFDVRASDGRVLATLDRGALPLFGIEATGVHVNGLVRRADGLHLWIGHRAMDKALDPGKLDHVVAGGVPAGLTPRETLVKEAGEEAAIPPALAARAVEVARIAYAMERPEGLRRDRLLCYDLELPEDFVPRPSDGEVALFELWPVTRVLEAVRETDMFKFNVNLVLIDLFLRLGLVDRSGDEGRALAAGLAGGTPASGVQASGIQASGGAAAMGISRLSPPG